MPSWHVAASSEGSLICQRLHKTPGFFQHRRPPEDLRAVLAIPRAHTGAKLPGFTGEECLEQRGRDGTARDLASIIP